MEMKLTTRMELMMKIKQKFGMTYVIVLTIIYDKAKTRTERCDHM